MKEFVAVAVADVAAHVPTVAAYVGRHCSHVYHIHI